MTACVPGIITVLRPERSAAATLPITEGSAGEGGAGCASTPTSCRDTSAGNQRRHLAIAAARPASVVQIGYTVAQPQPTVKQRRQRAAGDPEKPMHAADRVFLQPRHAADTGYPVSGCNEMHLTGAKIGKARYPPAIRVFTSASASVGPVDCVAVSVLHGMAVSFIPGVCRASLPRSFDDQRVSAITDAG